MIVDYHLHTWFSRHASGSIEEYLEQAGRLGLDEVCFTEHASREYLPTDVRKQIKWTWMQIGELPSYLEQLAFVGNAASIPVRRGLEVDYIDGYGDHIRRFLASADLDFVLGSIHFMKQYKMMYIGQICDEPLRFLLTYFRTVQKAIESRAFDSIAHLHLGWQVVPWPKGKIEARQAEEALATVVKAAKSSDTCLEVNTRSFAFEGYGTLERYCCFLKLISDFRVPVTIGSDAHSPTQVGRYFSQVLDTLRKYDIREVAVFRNRKRELMPLSDLVNKDGDI